MVVQWVTKTIDGHPAYFACQDAGQLAYFHTLGWTDTAAPSGGSPDDYRVLTTLDLGAPGGAAKLGLDGDVVAEELPPSVTGLSYAQVAAMFTAASHSGATVAYDSTAHTITITVTGGGGVDAETVRDTVMAMLVGVTGITETENDAGDTDTFSLDKEYVQDAVAAMFAGSHTNATVTYTDNGSGDGVLTISAAGGGTPGTDSITQAMLQDHVVGKNEVVAADIPVFNAQGAVTLADGTSEDAGTASTHGWVQDLVATVVGLIYNLFKARGLVVANADGTPLSLQATSGTDAVPAVVGNLWQMKPLSDFGVGGGGSGQLLRHTLFDPYVGNARKFSAALADAVAPATGFGVLSDGTHPVCNIGIFGDSVTEIMYAAWVDRFRHRTARFNQGAMPPGWVSGSDATSPVQPLQFGLTTTGTPIGGDNVEVPRGLAIAGYALAPGAELTLQDNTDATATATFDWAKFLYTATKTNGTSLQISIDGSVVGTVASTQDAALAASPGYESGRTALTWTGTLTSHTNIKVKNTGSQIAYFDGVYLGDQRERVRVWNAGNAGTKYSSYLTSVNPGALQSAKNLDFDLVFAAWGINDYADGLTTFGNNITQWWTDVRAVLPDVSCGGLAPYATSTRADWASYVAMMKLKFAAASVPILDLSWPIQTNATTTDPRDLVFSDNVHQNAAFGELYAQEMSKFVFGDHIDWLNAAQWLLRGNQQATFAAASAGIATIAGLIVKAPATGGIAKSLLVHDTGSASSGQIGEWGIVGRGATGMLGAGGVNLISGWRQRTNGTLTDSSAPVDWEFWGAASGSTTLAKRLTLLSGGMIKYEETTVPAGVADTVIVGARDTNGVTQQVAVMPDSSVQVLATPGTGRRASSVPNTWLAENFPRSDVGVANVAAPTASGTLFLTQIWLEAGTPVNKICFFTGTTAVTGLTHGGYGLWDLSLNRLAVTADQTSGQWGSTSTPYPLNTTAQYIVTSSGFYYAGIWQVATTPSSLLGIVSNGATWGLAPIVTGTSSTGLTSSAPNPAGAVTVSGLRPYVLVG